MSLETWYIAFAHVSRMPRIFADADENVWQSNVFKSNGFGAETCTQNKLKHFRIGC